MCVCVWGGGVAKTVPNMRTTCGLSYIPTSRHFLKNSIRDLKKYLAVTGQFQSQFQCNEIIS